MFMCATGQRLSCVSLAVLQLKHCRDQAVVAAFAARPLAVIHRLPAGSTDVF